MSPTASTQQAVIMTKDCKHNGAVPVKIGPYMVHLAREREISYDLTALVDYVVPLNGNLPAAYFGSVVKVIHSPLKDFGGVPEFWPKYIADVIKNFLAKDKRLLAWCTGSHGRTGCWAASLISVLEPDTEDPIAAIRQRHCKHAVETMAQAVAIFALRGEQLPEHYVKEFTPKPVVYAASNAAGGRGKNEIPKGCSPIPTVKIGSQDFIQSSNLTEFVWKQAFGSLSPKLLSVAGARPTKEEYQVFMSDASYQGFKVNVTPKTEVAVSFEGYDFIETEDKTCLVSKLFNTADRYMLNITTEMPTKEDYLKFLNDSYIRGFRRVKAGEVITVEEVLPEEDQLSHVIDKTQLAYEVYDTSSAEDSPEETPELFVEIEGEHTFVVEEAAESGNYVVYLTLFEPIGKVEMTTDEFERLPYMHIPKGSKVNEYAWTRFVDEARFKGFKIAVDSSKL